MRPDKRCLWLNNDEVFPLPNRRDTIRNGGKQLEVWSQAKIFLALCMSSFVTRQPATPRESPFSCFWYNGYMELGSLGGLIAFVLGWFFAQSGKFIGDMVIKKRTLSFSEVVDCFTRSGGMPSGHTASFTGLTVFLGLQNGFTSGLFVLALAMTIIVIYDAVNVRFAVGEQGKLLNIIAESDNNKKTRKMKVVEGHTIPQVCVGAALGILLGYLCFLWF